MPGQAQMAGRGGQQGWGVLVQPPMTSHMVSAQQQAHHEQREERHLLMGSKEGQGTCCNYLAKFKLLLNKEKVSEE